MASNPEEKNFDINNPFKIEIEIRSRCEIINYFLMQD
jgi:hypothetical protein